MTLVTDSAFKPILDGKTPFSVWRVKQMKLSLVPEKDWGKFYAGDSYLVWDSGFQGQGHQHIFFWLGADSTTDEKTVAAIKAVELDNLFNGRPVQHMEEQGYESDRFKKLFRQGLVILSGGAETGLKHLQQGGHVTRMYQVRGGKTPVLAEVGVDWSNMNHGDTFVVDSGTIIFVWVGSKSSPMEKVAAGGLANRLRDKVGEEIVFVQDGQEEEDLDESELKVWNGLLPLEKRGLVCDPVVGGDRKVSTTLCQDICLYQVSDVSGELKVDLVKKGKLEQADLNKNDAFVVEAGSLGVWVWLGRQASIQERTGAMGVGQRVVKDLGLAEHTRVTKVSMGGEPEEFRSLFSKW